MAKRSFQPISRVTGPPINVNTGGFPDEVVVDLDDKDPNNYTAVDVEVIDDTPEEDRGKPTQVDRPLEVSEAELSGMSKSVQSRIKRLSFETNTERRGREQAERERDAAVQAARAARSEAEQLRAREGRSTVALGSAMLSRNETALAAAQTKLTKAIEDGDAAAQAAAMTEVSTLSAEKLAIKSRIPPEGAKPAPAAQPAPQQPPQQQVPRAPLEPNVVAWVAHNRGWFGRPGQEERTRLAYALNNSLLKRGLTPSSEEFTRELDKGLKAVYSDHKPFGAQGSGGERKSARPSAVADGSRESESSTNNGGASRKVTLTASQLALAKKLGVTPQAYAVEELKRQDRIGNGATR